MIWEWLTSTVRGPAGHRGQNVVPCVAEVHAPDIASVTHRPQVAQDEVVLRRARLLVGWVMVKWHRT